MSEKEVFSSQQWVTFITFCIANFFAASVSSLQAPFYPEEAERKGSTALEVGWVFGIFPLVFFIASSIVGNHIKCLGAKRVFLAGVGTMGLSCFFFGFLNNVISHAGFLTLSFLLRISEAIGSASLCTASFSLIAEVFPNSVATTFASLEMFYGSGLIFGPIVGGALYGAGGFFLPFTVMGLSLAGVAVLTHFSLPRGLFHEKTGDKKRSILSLLKVPAALISALSIFTCNSSFGFLNATLEPHIRQFELSELHTGLVFMLGGVAYSVSSPLWGKIIDAGIPAKCILLVGCFFLTAAHLSIGPAAFIPAPTTLPAVCVGVLLHGIGIGAIQVAGFILSLKESIARGFPDDLQTYGLVSGLWASSASLGNFVGSAVGGHLLEAGGFRLASLFPLIMALLAAGANSLYIIGFRFSCRIKSNSTERIALLKGKNERIKGLYTENGKCMKSKKYFEPKL